jgi:PAS domain-containing protein
MKLWVKFGILLVIGLGLIFGGGYYIFQSEQESLRQQTFRSLARSVDVAIASIDVSNFEYLRGQPEDASSTVYALTRSQFGKLGSIFHNDGIRGIYAMRVDPPEVRFIVDSAPIQDPWHSEPGVLYQLPPPEIGEVAAGATERFAGPYTDEYGNYYSVFKPLRDTSGAVLAVIGADIETESFQTLVNKQRQLPLFFICLRALIFVVMLYVLFKNREVELLVKSYNSNLESKNAEAIRQKKQSEENARRLEGLIEHLPIGVLIVDAHRGRPTLSNAKAAALLGRPVDTNKGAKEYIDVYQIMREDGKRYIDKELPLMKTLNTQSLSEGFIYIPRKDQTRMKIRMVASPIKDVEKKMTSIVVLLEEAS